ALGDLALRQADLAAADRHYQAALPLYRAIQDHLGEANCQKALGDLALRQADLAAADRHYQAALPLFRAIQARLGEANCLQSLGRLLLARNELAAAFGRFLDVLAVFQEIRDGLGEQAAFGYLARTAATVGHTDQALALAERSRQIGRAIDDRFGQLINLELQTSLLGNAEEMEAALAAVALHQQLAVAIQDQNKIERYRSWLERVRQEIPADVWEQFEQSAEAILAQAVAAAEQRLGGRDPLVWVESIIPQ
ncbi:MAG: tetratricopeptide repeat protein, partial [Candidatus Competibacteraceae bacterium]|nr:tetratricopeptide repeat protein [Candidatus Competibacteraceae bacterium]